MRLSWRGRIAMLLVGTWSIVGCVQTPGDKSVQDLRPIQNGKNLAKKTELTAGDIVTNFSEKKRAEDIAINERIRDAGGPQAITAARKLAMLHETTGNYDRAEDECKRLLQWNPKDADALAKLGDLFAHRKQWGAAEKSYRDALFVQQGHVAARSGLAFALARQGDYSKSLDEFCRVLSSKAEAYCEVAFVMQLDGKHQDAIQAYQYALTIEPNLQRARTELAKLQQTPSISRVGNGGFLPMEGPARDLQHVVRDGRRVLVEMETPAPFATEGTSRMQLQRPSLPAMPAIEP
jgi:tetratricopeptide (TPR) repeat protein